VTITPNQLCVVLGLSLVRESLGGKRVQLCVNPGFPSPVRKKSLGGKRVIQRKTITVIKIAN
jgi:hypothetical protein